MQLSRRRRASSWAVSSAPRRELPSNGKPYVDSSPATPAAPPPPPRAGKYLNTIRECGQPVVRPLPEGARLQYDAHGLFQQHVAAAHRAASAALLRFMLEEQQLLALLRAIKHFFLLDQVRPPPCRAGGPAAAPALPCPHAPGALPRGSVNTWAAWVLCWAFNAPSHPSKSPPISNAPSLAPALTLTRLPPPTNPCRATWPCTWCARPRRSCSRTRSWSTARGCSRCWSWVSATAAAAAAARPPLPAPAALTAPGPAAPPSSATPLSAADPCGSQPPNPPAVRTSSVGNNRYTDNLSFKMDGKSTLTLVQAINTPAEVRPAAEACALSGGTCRPLQPSRGLRCWPVECRPHRTGAP
jgi:hypothetical protein